MNKCDEIGYYYLFLLNPWQYDNATGVFINIPDEYKLKLDLNPPAANATAATIELYNSRQKIIDKHNTKFRELRSDIRSIISKRCGVSLNKNFNEYGVDPLKIWKYLLDTFGSGTTSELDAGDIAVDLGYHTMKNNEHFTNWIREFEGLADRCQASVIIRKGYLLSDGRGKLKIKLLPKRFDEAVRHCRQTRKTYDECKVYLEDSCNNDFSRNIVTEQHDSERIHAVNLTDCKGQGPMCHNCSNYGHFAQQCNVTICIKCATCDHLWKDCNLRSKNKRSKVDNHYDNNKKHVNKRFKKEHNDDESRKYVDKKKDKDDSNDNDDRYKPQSYRGRGRRGKGRGGSRGHGNQRHKNHIDLVSINSSEDMFHTERDEEHTNCSNSDDDEYCSHYEDDKEIDSKTGHFTIYNLFGKHSDNDISSKSNKTINVITLHSNKKGTSINSISLPNRREQKLDTGAQVTVARSCTNMNLRNTKQYDSNCPCPLHLSSASGNKMDIIATGHEKLVGKTYVCDVETDLISGPALQKRRPPNKQCTLLADIY